MLHDVTFNNEKSAYKDWNIVLTEVELPPPEPKTMAVEITGADGIIDLSEVLTGDIKYSTRKIKLKFEVMDDKQYYSITSEIAKYLHGKNVTFKLNDDDNYYYTGRAIINSWECVKRKGVIIITIVADPYKYEITEKIYTITLRSNETKDVVLINGRKHVCPILDVTGSVNLIWNGATYTLSEGKQQVIRFVLNEGNNLVSFTGTGTVKVTYRRGES